MYGFSLLFLKFIIFSMIGYVFEMIYCAIIDRKITNRGFFCGPIIPIYGFGSLFLIYLLKPFSYDIKNLFNVFFLGMLITGALEYLTSYLLEKIFHNKWWDYSQEKFYINLLKKSFSLWHWYANCFIFFKSKYFLFFTPN